MKATFSIHNITDEDLAELGIKAKKAFLFRAEAEFHKQWKLIGDEIRTGKSFCKELIVSVHVADVTFDGESTEAEDRSHDRP